MFVGDDDGDHHGLTDYELERVAHIRRNRAIMRQLGLGDHDIVTAARGRCGEKVVVAESKPSSSTKKRKKSCEDDCLGKNETNPAARASSSSPCESIEAGIARVLRRSRRLAEKPAVDDGKVIDGDAGDKRSNDEYKYRYLDDYELDKKHAADAEAYARRNAGCQARVSIVGTASYQHTLMRVRTMRAPALANRVKAIERAKGKHAVVKMRLFARVLFLEGLEDLAEEAVASLDRLVRELGDPEEDEEE
jgi:hypothetical protein